MVCNFAALASSYVELPFHQAPFDKHSWWRETFEKPIAEYESAQESDDVRCHQDTNSLVIRRHGSAAKLAQLGFARLISLLRPIFWRHSKEMIGAQLNLPQLVAQVHTLAFSSTERVWYDSQRDACAKDFRALLRKLKKEIVGVTVDDCDLIGSDTEWMEALSKEQWRRVFVMLGRLRQACCHPQVRACY